MSFAAMGDYYGYEDYEDGIGNHSLSGNQSVDDHYYNYDYSHEYTEFVYEAFDFERPIYMFVWEILVIFTTLFNIVVIIVLLRKKMRNVIHMILVAIAISDSMTGLVTLPTYIYVYSQYEPGVTGSLDAYILKKEWCNAFMLSKFFLSKWFHNISIWLTLVLGIQRFVSVILPFEAQRLFTLQKTLVCVIIIFVVSPVLHIYHAITPKANEHGFCQWTLDDKWGLVYLWVTLLLMHLIPCISLFVLTAVMIYRLYSATSQLVKGEGSHSSMIERRQNWNRRMSIIVTTIVIAFLIPEIPYGIFLLYSVVRVHSGKRIMSLQANRAFHAVYEILLVLSFHANFWIYTILNKRFRSELKRTFRELQNSVYTMTGKPTRKISITSTSFSGGKTAESDMSGKNSMKLREIGASSTSDSKSERNPLKDPSSDKMEEEDKV